MQETPKPTVVRLYKNQMKYLKTTAKKTKTSKAAVVRYLIDEAIIGPEF